VQSFLGLLLNLYVLALLGRVILSWFPMNPGSAMVGVYSFLYSVTEPLLGPVRRMLPSFGGLDLSPLIVIFGIQILGSKILGRPVGIL
jgi:YggT family protein